MNLILNFLPSGRSRVLPKQDGFPCDFLLIPTYAWRLTPCHHCVWFILFDNTYDMQLWQLETLLLQKDTYLNYSQALSYTSQALSQNLQGLRKKNRIKRMSTEFVYYLQENWRRLWVLSLWILIMIGLFTWKFFQYKHKDAFHVMGYCLLTAKGAAETLKFNMALILLPVCRNTITWLRSTRLGFFVPFDDNINFHKVCASYI